ncbi:hypothetical protein P3T23_002093 [Paraburkholderia sp. GAS448]|uniref:hypothetical protein n=1 Tax=Paraburkholderia sp. GAS448 TaxID=3035136 RepID=UPI003D1B151D
MLRICNTCHAIQKKNSSGKCNQRGCSGKLEKAWKCSACDKVQESTFSNKCRERGCKGVLQKLKDEIAHGSAPPRDVMPSSHVYMGTASQASSLVVEKDESKSSEPIGNIHDRLNLMLAKGPPPVRLPASSPTTPVLQTESAPKVLRSEIPSRSPHLKLDIERDAGIARALMASREMRRIVVTNMLADYDPSDGARKALKMTQSSSSKMSEMTATMLVNPTDAPGWDLMGAKALRSQFAACQQCVAIVFHKLIQNPAFSSTIRLIHVPGHHFLVFGDFSGSSSGWRVYIVDLWLQNLHRPDCDSVGDLDRDSSEWQVLVIRLDDDKQTWYRDRLSQWVTDLEHDPMA